MTTEQIGDQRLEKSAISSVRRDVPSRASRKFTAEAGTASVKLSGESAGRLKQLETEANAGGARRVQSKDIVALALERITSDDLRRLRELKATVDDHFDSSLQAFQKKNVGATRQDFLAHLLALAKTNN